ncbi:hypothetical protein SERLA73DRAFT_133212 [Serpula lacrymans var. lacrymans S7.3]|uniref:Uncharacterized protein n=2 Tax=Serpula lacrymans var. lacrymans TaxID=341189 RepID=F8PQT9_SERL3|nr:uncharacterized protein SERLADRAFT_383952 [Serpula lacrymans var. lacrymans S7.9]EGO02283.1 hypothetical protein SERLA73DRAFT_133212 [Serpula lacrymans var. lacrymans S7.3]EGO28025.1 hypothetical protein SERLADRAFT_383952 [Serpula lacrymans var. lacrymans S7.9]
MASVEEIIMGDFVAVNHDRYGRREGMVVGSYVDYAGRTILEVQLEPNEVYAAWYPTVTRVKRTVSYATRPTIKQRTVERRIYW